MQSCVKEPIETKWIPENNFKKGSKKKIKLRTIVASADVNIQKEGQMFQKTAKLCTQRVELPATESIFYQIFLGIEVTFPATVELDFKEQLF